jgi:hypothetical protein
MRIALLTMLYTCGPRCASECSRRQRRRARHVASACTPAGARPSARGRAPRIEPAVAHVGAQRAEMKTTHKNNPEDRRWMDQSGELRVSVISITACGSGFDGRGSNRTDRGAAGTRIHVTEYPYYLLVPLIIYRYPLLLIDTPYYLWHPYFRWLVRLIPITCPRCCRFSPHTVLG